MNGTKKWWQSKTNLAAACSIILSVYYIVATQGVAFGLHLPPVPDWVTGALQSVLGGIVIYGRNTATTTIE